MSEETGVGRREREGREGGRREREVEEEGGKRGWAKELIILAINPSHPF